MWQLCDVFNQLPFPHLVQIGLLLTFLYKHKNTVTDEQYSNIYDTQNKQPCSFMFIYGK